MIHWAWLIPACMISGGVGFLVCAMFSINKCEGCQYRKEENPDVR